MDGQKVKIKSPQTSAAAKIAALRAQLQVELQNKKQCAYQPFECTQLTLDGYNYCLRHILEDKSAPFKQCAYVFSSNSKRCYLPAPKGEKKEFGYCNEHALKAHLSRTKQGCRYPPPRTAETLLHSLSHYVKRSRTHTNSSSTQCSEDDRNTPDETESKVTKSLDPFTEIDAKSVNTSCCDILDMCSESESDIEPSIYSTVWQDAHADSSDNESIDSDQEDTLKHANVYTAEEITIVTREKLIKLQSLYIEQYKHLQHLLKEQRRKYLHALRREKETFCSIHNQARDNPKEQRLYKKLTALNQYHHKNGVDAILSKRVHELRAKITDGVTPKVHTYVKCVFTEGGVKCGARALPVARHCRKHILEDPNQVLFRACGKQRADVECNTPVEAIFDDNSCPLHMDIPALRSYSQIRKDSESDYDEPMEANASQLVQSSTQSSSRAIDLTSSNVSVSSPNSNFPMLLENVKKEIDEELSELDLIDMEMEEIHKGHDMVDCKSQLLDIKLEDGGEFAQDLKDVLEKSDTELNI